MVKLPRIQEMLSNDDEFIQMISYKRLEDVERKGSKLSKMPFEDFTLFSNIGEDEKLKNHFIKMQRIYVFDEKDMFEYEEIVKSMVELNEVLLTLDEGLAFEEIELQMNMY